MADKKISQLTANTNPSGLEELVYAYNNTNGKMSLNTMKTFVGGGKQDTLVSGVNIKTINHKSILGSGNINIEGGGGGGGEEITELGGDANIWELSEGIYVTDYDLYYKSGSKISVYSAGGATHRQMLFVEEEGAQTKGFFVYNVGENSTYTYSRASFGYSKSSSDGEVHLLKEWDASLKGYNVVSSQTVAIEAIGSNSGVGFTQLVDNINGTNPLNSVLRVDGTLYSGVTYTVIVNSIDSNYTVTLGTGVTNPLDIALPTSSNKPCIITLVATSDTTAIVTSCTIKS